MLLEKNPNIVLPNSQDNMDTGPLFVKCLLLLCACSCVIGHVSCHSIYCMSACLHVCIFASLQSLHVCISACLHVCMFACLQVYMSWGQVELLPNPHSRRPASPFPEYQNKSSIAHFCVMQRLACPQAASVSTPILTAFLLTGTQRPQAVGLVLTSHSQIHVFMLCH